MSRSRTARVKQRIGVSAFIAVLGLALWQPAGWSQADTTSEVIVPTAAEAWFNTTPLPVGELPVVPPATNPYEANTLHVRVVGGQENARTYLTLDLSELSSDVEIKEGFLTLPLMPTEAEAEDDPTARFQACLAGLMVKSEDGSFDAPPEVDCKVKSGAIFTAKPDPHFTVNLAPFVDLLATNSLALVPTDSAREDADTWHVAFYGKKYESKEAVPITAKLVTQEFVVPDFDDPAPPTENFDPAPISGGSSSFDSGSLSLGGGSTVTSGGALDGADNPAVAGAPVTVAAPETEPAVATDPAYTVVWVLPLVLLLLGGYFTSALTRDVVAGRRRRT